MVLHNVVKEKDDKFADFLTFLGASLSQDKIQKINQHFLNEWNINENLMPSLNVEYETMAAAEATCPTSTVAAAQEERFHFDQSDMKDFTKLIEFFSTKQEELD